MTELDTLRPEVRERFTALDEALGELDAKYAAMRERAEKADAELAALKARIAESQECGVVALCGGGISLSHEPRESLVGKRVRLLVDEPQDDNAKEGPEC